MDNLSGGVSADDYGMWGCLTSCWALDCFHVSRRVLVAVVDQFFDSALAGDCTNCAFLFSLMSTERMKLPESNCWSLDYIGVTASSAMWYMRYDVRFLGGNLIGEPN